MEIVLLDLDRWAVVADWLGEQRIVYRSHSIWACIRYVREQSQSSH